MNHCDPYSSKIGLTVLFYANKSKYQKLTVLQKYQKKISKIDCVTERCKTITEQTLLILIIWRTWIEVCVNCSIDANIS